MDFTTLHRLKYLETQLSEIFSFNSTVLMQRKSFNYALVFSIAQFFCFQFKELV